MKLEEYTDCASTAFVKLWFDSKRNAPDGYEKIKNVKDAIEKINEYIWYDNYVVDIGLIINIDSSDKEILSLLHWMKTNHIRSAIMFHGNKECKTYKEIVKFLTKNNWTVIDNC